MKYYDITIPLSPATPAWPGDQAFTRQETRGSGIVSKLIMSSHTGTHIDAPKHFLFSRGGIDSIAWSKLIGPFQVFAINSQKLISLNDVRKLPLKPGMRILFKTRNSNFVTKQRFTSDYVSLSVEAAQYLARKKIALVGIDYFGIEAKSAPGHPVHKTLLAKKIVIAEGLNLKNIKPGVYNGAILPLLITKGDGAPARAILWR